MFQLTKDKRGKAHEYMQGVGIIIGNIFYLIMLDRSSGKFLS